MPKSKECLERFDALKKTSLNVEQIGAQILREFPNEFYPGCLPRSVYVGCHRELQNIQGQADAPKDLLTDDVIPHADKLPESLQVLELPYVDCLLLSDVHVPFHDRELLHEALVFAKKNKLRRAVFNGDMFDMLRFSAYENLATEDFDSTLDKAADLFEACFDHGIQEITYSAGNHEHRIERKAQLPVMKFMGHVINVALDRSPSLAKSISKRVKYTNMFWQRFTDTPDRINWEIHHQWNFRAKRLSTVMDLALKQTRCHTATGHEHHFGVSVTEDGCFWAVNLPSTQDDTRVEYMVRRKRAGSKHVKGFGWLIDGVPGLWWDSMAVEHKDRLLKGLYR